MLAMRSARYLDGISYAPRFDLTGSNVTNKMKSFANIYYRVKNVAEDLLTEWGYVAIVFLVGLISFGLGRLSATEMAQPVVSIVQAAEVREPRGMHIGGLIVASRKGSAYHFPWCGGASSIAAANRIWFESEQAAQDAGYRPAKNCKGLSHTIGTE
jgi:hypothetical protein